MNYYQIIAITILIFIHLYIMYIEMMLWNTKKGMKIFGLRSKEFADETKVLAANQGLYNGFLGAGLLWSLIIQNKDVALFFLIFIFIAGIFGAYSTKKITILYFQTIPSLIAIFLILSDL
ncbi:MAG: DUF1304 domain-containing protein [Flavobacteriia bacterium]|nr:DUF1304 domain-containing protein [Flavobacteriia bacterium]OIP48169.1 MAG: hypothetical protein AUK46_02795 [Flavobacteriaceae bacterium CG2_30_31_66]PIV97874.1 MAG: DUF1304 domain-containing protein [Flavobacteriaceae bacterium CG17_big_fil_post_rev_8_21_14_2_50_31_13]PIX13129.1 MAG: DUF1304 domain-containing protein [Flavobacteriaceae bacterium CG_4_8_14_3_um_filter_31_8]PIY14615.1 MAG: DUF1304 domain-containing protein [Flavobacteriaceae bacterium CG_4_10_14_3_um_filter_31_253]PIZ10882.